MVAGGVRLAVGMPEARRMRLPGVLAVVGPISPRRRVGMAATALLSSNGRIEMKTWARIQHGRVAETLTTEQPIEALFPPSLVWIDASAQAGVSQGWRWTRTSFAPPLPATPPAAAALPNLATIAQQIVILQAQLATYSAAATSGVSGSAGMTSVVGGGSVVGSASVAGGSAESGSGGTGTGTGSVAGSSSTSISGSGSAAPVET